MTAADRLLRQLEARQPIDEPVALVVAHPDDETIGAGAVLPLFRRLILVHVTDGAPRNLADAMAHGFPDGASYAAARREELRRALGIAGVAPECMELGAADQGASERLVPLTRALRDVLTRHAVTTVLTHPYEGGHPDHDATAFIAAHCGRVVVEFASYHARPNGGVVTGEFLAPAKEPSLSGRGLDEGERKGVRLTLTVAEQQRKLAMLACFITQATTLAPFGTGHELFRPAPHYDFTLPPHAGPLHYERYDWGMSGERWRRLAAEARTALC